jgi:cytochrome bd-type quinol oxidase subunit 2
MFLPRVLHDYAATLQIRDSAGGTHPLVRGERVLFQSTRPPEPSAPPRLWSYLLLIGLFVGGVLVWLASKAGRSRGARVTLAVLATLWCVIAGLLGVVLTILWTLTDHRFAHANENLLLFNPLWLILAVCVAIYVASGKVARFTGLLAALLAGLTVVALLAHAVFISRQENLAIVLLALPPALALSLITWTPRRPSA